MKIYFAASIYGGRELLEDYKSLVMALKSYGEVLSEEIVDTNLLQKEEKISLEEIYLSDIEKIKQADVIFAELTNPSLGVGYELGYSGVAPPWLPMAGTMKGFAPQDSR